MERIELGESYPNCFACGKENKAGLKLVFFREEDRVVSECVLSRRFQGFPALIHGGIACVLLDEVMAWTIWACLARFGLTEDLHVLYHRPLRVGKKVRLIGRVKSHSSCAAEVCGEIRSGSGLLCVEGSAHFRLLSARGREIDQARKRASPA